jgi:hypothetical protein
LLLLLYTLVLTVQFVESGIHYWMTLDDGEAHKAGTELLRMAVAALVKVGVWWHMR